ncbi:MAG TPA: oligosaccharide flippase family protein [Flavobacteriales bacterium]|nr:oligosaccharide flippase family protein [Flavobacteriales bacterium]
MSLKRGIFYTFLTQVPTLLLFFVANTLMTRTLGDEGRGGFALFQNLVALITMMLGFSLNFGITYFTSKDQGDPTRMVRVCTSLLLVNLISVPLLFLFIFSHPGLHSILLPASSTHWGYLVYLTVLVLLCQINNFINSIMLGLKRFKVINKMSIFTAALSATGYTLLYLLQDRLEPHTVLPVVLGLHLSYILANTLVWTFSYVRLVGIRPVPTWSWAIIQPVLAFVLVAYASNLINLINYRFNIWVVDHYTSTAQLGLYAVALGLGQLLFYIPDPFNTVVQPYLYGEMNRELMGKFKFIMRLNFTTVALLALALGIVAPWLIPLLFGDAFAGSVRALWWLLPGIAFAASSKLLGPLVVQGNLIRFNLYGVAVATLFTIALSFLLVPRLGIEGAGIASSIAFLVNLIVQCVVVSRRMRVSIWDIFILRPSDLVWLKAIVRKRLHTP